MDTVDKKQNKAVFSEKLKISKIKNFEVANFKNFSFKLKI